MTDRWYGIESTSVSVAKHTGIIITNMFLQGLFLQPLHKGISTVVSIQTSLLVSLQDDILHHLCKDNSASIFLHSSLLTSLRNEFLQSSLLTSLRNGFLQSSLPVSLRSEFLQSSLLASLWNIFLRSLYRDISKVTSIPSKPEIFLQSICKFMIISKQVKPEPLKSWLLSHTSLQSFAKLFYKYIGYYVIDQNTINNTWNIRR